MGLPFGFLELALFLFLVVDVNFPLNQQNRKTVDMCSPAVIEQVRKRISRRNALSGLGVVGASAVSGCVPPVLRKSEKAEKEKASLPEDFYFSRVVDLSHTLHPDFPAWFEEGVEVTTKGKRTFVPPAIVDVKPVFEWEHDKVNLNQVTYWEHVGTHMDAPAHFSEGRTVDEIPVEDLILPLAVIDIKARAEKDPLALLNVEDIRSWEDKHGLIPDRACVAMNSGWADHVDTPRYKSLDENGKHRQPAFHIDAVHFLMEYRNVVSLAVDTFSFDNQHSPENDVHYSWLGDERWGIENVNNLDEVPPLGATVIVGQPSIKGGSGGPNRTLALV